VNRIATAAAAAYHPRADHDAMRPPLPPFLAIVARACAAFPARAATRRIGCLVALGTVLALAGGAGAATAGTQTSWWEFIQWRTGVSVPVALRFAPDGRLFFIELWSGKIRVFADTTAATSTIWATVPVVTQNDRGLLGLAIHPAFPDSPYVYVFHTNPSPLVNRVVRLTDQAGVGTNYTVIVDNLPTITGKHEGGRLVFGPDGMLYVTYGDNYVASYAPDPGDVRGKVLRYTPMGQPAPGNPFGAGNPVFAKGVRNSFGLCFDPQAGYGYFTDNGTDCDDEVNFLAAGADYGWSPTYACQSQPPGCVTPIWRYTPTIGLTGACVYRGARYPELDGNIIFGGFNDGYLRRIILNPDVPGLALFTATMAREDVNDLVLDVTVGPDEGIWACGPGSIMRLSPVEGATAVGDLAAAGALTVAPNPFSTTLAMRCPQGTVIERLEVVDLGGRRVRRWDGPLTDLVVWDGRDHHGRAVPAGVYLLRGTAAGRAFASRVVKLAH
jgi:glucose/arabinose dehydrogenase